MVDIHEIVHEKIVHESKAKKLRNESINATDINDRSMVHSGKKVFNCK